jgi:hypothetical protein
MYDEYGIDQADARGHGLSRASDPLAKEAEPPNMTESEELFQFPSRETLETAEVIVVLGNSIYERSATAPPRLPIRHTQPARSWGERRVAGTRLRRKRCCHSNSLWLRDPHRPASEKRPLDESAVKQLVTVTELGHRCALQAAQRSYR